MKQKKVDAGQRGLPKSPKPQRTQAERYKILQKHWEIREQNRIRPNIAS